MRAASGPFETEERALGFDEAGKHALSHSVGGAQGKPALRRLFVVCCQAIESFRLSAGKRIRMAQMISGFGCLYSEKLSGSVASWPRNSQRKTMARAILGQHLSESCLEYLRRNGWRF
jgi:hypothetical protein